MPALLVALASGLLFGLGWGLVGYCPGPALAAFGLGVPGAGLFVAAMLAGIGAHDVMRSIRVRRAVAV